jgi:hypothetical protein
MDFNAACPNPSQTKKLMILRRLIKGMTKRAESYGSARYVRYA